MTWYFDRTIDILEVKMYLYTALGRIRYRQTVFRIVFLVVTSISEKLGFFLKFSITLRGTW